MADRESPYERVKGGRLSFRGGAVPTIDKKKKKKKKKINKEQQLECGDVVDDSATGSGSGLGLGATDGEVVYTIDAARKMKYEELFPVETKKFGYDPKAKVKSVEEALDDRIKKKADRYCK